MAIAVTACLSTLDGLLAGLGASSSGVQRGVEGLLLVHLTRTGPQEATCPGPGVQPRWKGCGRGAETMPQSDLNMQVCCHCSSVSTGVDNASGPGRNVSEAGGERQVAPPSVTPESLRLERTVCKALQLLL